MKRLKHILRSPKESVYEVMESPVGCLTIIASTAGIHHILWEYEGHSTECQNFLSSLKKNPDHAVIRDTKKQLLEYFANKRKVFDVPVAANGTPFQMQAWKALCDIPYGQTISYGEQARRLGDKKKARAVGMANGHNPVSIIVPCHRVIGSNGDLTGFGGGIENKKYLLELEKHG